MASQVSVRPTSKKWFLKKVQVAMPWNMIHSMPCRNPCPIYIHLAFTYSIGPSTEVWNVKWTWTRSASSTNESAWSGNGRGLSVSCVKWPWYLFTHLCEYSLILYFNDLKKAVVKVRSLKNQGFRHKSLTNTHMITTPKVQLSPLEPLSIYKNAWSSITLSSFITMFVGLTISMEYSPYYVWVVEYST